MAAPVNGTGSLPEPRTVIFAYFGPFFAPKSTFGSAARAPSLCAETRQDSWTVRALLSGSFGSSLSRILPELAMRCLYGDLVCGVTIVMPSESALVPVPSAAPKARRLSGREWRPRATVPTESIGEHRGAVTAIDGDIADAISTVSDLPPVCEHP